MARNDYWVIVLKVLAYLYECFRDGKQPEERAFRADSCFFVNKPIPDDYWNEILCDLDADGLVRGMIFVKAWGGMRIFCGFQDNFRITSKGIDYLQENKSIRKAFDALKDIGDAAAPFIGKMLGW